MALGINVVPEMWSERGNIVRPVSTFSTWRTIIDAGGLVILDNATITNPTTQITSSTRHIFSMENMGTQIILRMKYDNGSTIGTGPTVKVFGRTRNDVWQLLKTKALALNAAIGAAVTDTSDATALFNYTTPDLATQVWDCAGCAEILVGVEAVFTGSIANTASLQIKSF